RGGLAARGARGGDRRGGHSVHRCGDSTRLDRPPAFRGGPTTGAVMLDEKAVELGRLIGQSAEYQAVKRANEALNGDRDVVTTLQRMEQLRAEAQDLLSKGEQPTAEMEQELDQL